MQIFVQSLHFSGKRLTIEVEPSDSVENLKTKVQDAEDIPPAQIELFFNNTKLVDGTTLSSYSGLIKEVYIQSANNISQLATKQLKQVAKLNIAASKRSDTYDINRLPTKYNNNAVVNNPNSGGLLASRPWT